MSPEELDAIREQAASIWQKDRLNAVEKIPTLLSEIDRLNALINPLNVNALILHDTLEFIAHHEQGDHGVTSFRSYARDGLNRARRLASDLSQPEEEKP